MLNSVWVDTIFWKLRNTGGLQLRALIGIGYLLRLMVCLIVLSPFHSLLVLSISRFLNLLISPLNPRSFVFFVSSYI